MSISLEQEKLVKDLVKLRAPGSWLDFARRHHVNEVWLVDDDRLLRSVRSDDKVFVNSRGTYWKNYSIPPILAKSYEEVVVLRFLKEVGHTWLRHGVWSIIHRERVEDAPTLETTYEQDKEATLWAISTRDQQPQLFRRLLQDFRTWLASYTFKSRDW